MQLKVTRRGESVPLEVHDDMKSASDEQILSYAAEQFPDLDTSNMQVERTPEGILVHPTPTYG